MKAIEAYTIIKEEVEKSFTLFDGLDLILSIESEACDARLKAVSSIESARNISSTLTIGADGMSEEDYYCIYLGINVKRGEVNETELEKALSAFRSTVKKTVEALREGDTPSSVLLELGRVAEEEFEKIMEKAKKTSTTTGIGMALIVIGVLIMFLVATLY